jgi:UDP-glucose-4-epimerase GalE
MSDDHVNRVSEDKKNARVLRDDNHYIHGLPHGRPLPIGSALGPRSLGGLSLAILVTGGAGYIGSHAARALRRSGYEVVLYDNLSTGFHRLAQGFELVQGDIADEARLRPVLARVDSVMHFAAHAYVGESVAVPRKYFHNNILGGLSLLNSALDAGIRRFVFSSTCAVYGIPGKIPIKQLRVKQLRITEQTPREPVNPYGASKLFFENALQAYSQAYELRSVRLRYFNAAGADESGEIGELHNPETHLIPLALAATTVNGPELQVYGSDYPTPDGTCVRDYIHVNDLADAHVRALQYLEKNAGEESGDSLAVNLGTGRGYSVLEVIQAAERATGRAVRRRIGPRRPGDPPVLVADPAMAQSVLGWTAKRTLVDIVSSAWTWMQKNSIRS